MVPQNQPVSVRASATATIPELQQSKTAVLNTLASIHSRRSYAYAIERFIAWYCSEPRLEFNRAVVVKYRSFLERTSMSAATINLHLSAIRRLADESAETGWLSPELAIGIRRVKGVKRLGRKMGNWLTRNQAQELVNAASKTNLRGWRDGAMVGLLLGCGLRRSESRGIEPRSAAIERGPLGHFQSDRQGSKNTNRTRAMVGQGTCRCLAPTFRRERRQSIQTGLEGWNVTSLWRHSNVVWYAVKRCAEQAGINNLAPHDLRRTCARLCHSSGGELEQIQFLLGHASVQTTERYIGSKQKLQDAVNDRLGISVAGDSA